MSSLEWVNLVCAVEDRIDGMMYENYPEHSVVWTSKDGWKVGWSDGSLLQVISGQ